MGVGIGLGNTFDHPIHPTDAASTRARVSRYADAGPDTDLGRLFGAAWTSIATHFADRSHRLMFEVLNEPEGTMDDWIDGRHPRDPVALQLTREANAATDGGWAFGIQDVLLNVTRS